MCKTEIWFSCITSPVGEIVEDRRLLLSAKAITEAISKLQKATQMVDGGKWSP